MSSNSVRNHTSDNKIGRPRSGSPICLSQIELHLVLLPLQKKEAVGKNNKLYFVSFKTAFRIIAQSELNHTEALLLKLEIVITRAAPAFHKLFMVMG